MIGYQRIFLLCEEEYGILREFLPPLLPRSADVPPAPLFLRTGFYDTDDRKGNRCGTTYRIRETESGWEGGVKMHRLGAPERFGLWTTPARGMLDGRVFAPLRLRFYGTMTTYRHVLQSDKGFFVSLDRNLYPGGSDYELHIGYAKEYAEQVGMLVLDAGHLLYVRTGKEKNSLSARQTPPSKSERFFAARRERE